MFFLRRLIYFLLAGAFFGLFAFFVVALLLAFFAGLAALVVDVFAAAAVVDDAPAVPVDDFVPRVDELLFGFDGAAAIFFGAAFFFGLLALAVPAAFGLAAAFALGLALVAVLAFLAAGAFFLVALAAELAAVDGAGVAAAAVFVVVVALILVLVGFFVAAFFVAEAERFRLVAAPAALGLLDDRAFFVLAPPVFLLPLGVFDRLRDFVEVDFVAAFFF